MDIDSVIEDSSTGMFHKFGSHRPQCQSNPLPSVAQGLPINDIHPLLAHCNGGESLSNGFLSLSNFILFLFYFFGMGYQGILSSLLPDVPIKSFLCGMTLG